MGQITTTADSVYRDLEVPGNPGLGEHEPVKSAIRALFGLVDTSIAGAASGPKAYATYAEMAADVPQADRQFGVVSTEDEGTHTDPVNGGTVPNAGYYAFSLSPAGWEWLYPVVNDQLVVPCVASAAAGVWTVSPRSGYALPADVASAILVFPAPADSGVSVAVEVTGINVGDPRLLYRSTLELIAEGDIIEGGSCMMRFRGHAEDTPAYAAFEVLGGSGGSSAGVAEQSIVKLYAETRTNNNVLLAPAPGQVLKNNTALGIVFMWQAEADSVAGLGWSLAIQGVNDLDPYLLYDRQGEEIDPGQINAGDVLFFSRFDGLPGFRALQIWNEQGGETGGGSVDTTVAIQGGAQRAAYAEARARKPKAPAYSVATLPDAGLRGPGSLVYVEDATGGAVLAFSDGSNWLRSTDRTVVN